MGPSCWRSCLRSFKGYFVDLKFMGGLMSLWLLIVLIVLCELGVFTRSKFVAFGPRSDLTFMHVTIDTYFKYNILICMIVVHTFITDIIADSLAPHVLNVVQDTKNKYIPHRARTYILITSMWSIYCSVSQLFVIFIAFGQLDLLLVRLASDLIANFTTLTMYLDGKIYDPEMHTKSCLVLRPLDDSIGGHHHDSDYETACCGTEDKIVLFSITDDGSGDEIALDCKKLGVKLDDNNKRSEIVPADNNTVGPEDHSKSEEDEKQGLLSLK